MKPPADVKDCEQLVVETSCAIQAKVTRGVIDGRNNNGDSTYYDATAR